MKNIPSNEYRHKIINKNPFQILIDFIV